MALDDATRDLIEQQINSHRGVLYMKGNPRQPMCGFSAKTAGLLDSVLEIGEEHLIARITPDRQDPFANDHGIPGWVGLEWLAQAIAAWSGRAAREAGGEPRIGFLLGSRHYHCDVEHFVFDSPVEVKVELDYRADNGLGAFRGELRDAKERRLAHATLNVFQPDSAETLSAMLEDSAP